MEKNTKEISQKLIQKLKDKVKWENEYGGVHINIHNKEVYKNNNDFKVEYYSPPKSDTYYFKIVPKYFSLPCGHVYWEYYDGQIVNGSILWNTI